MYVYKIYKYKYVYKYIDICTFVYKYLYTYIYCLPKAKPFGTTFKFRKDTTQAATYYK